jgi:Protein of unknown function (DUF3592)
MEKYFGVLVFFGPIVGLLVLVTLIKYIEVVRARSWLQTSGKITAAKAVSRAVRIGVNNPAEMREFADVTYQFIVDGKKRTGSRVSIGEDLGNGDVAGTLSRYRKGTEVTVYYNPKNLDQTVLEREPPAKLFQIMVLFIAALIAGAIVTVDGAIWLADSVAAELPNPKNAPFVIGLAFFAFACALMARAIGKTKSKNASSDQTQSQGLWILWACCALLCVSAYWFATTSGGKI